MEKQTAQSYHGRCSWEQLQKLLLFMMGITKDEVEKAFGDQFFDFDIFIPKRRLRHRGWKIELEPGMIVTGPFSIPRKVKSIVGIFPASIKTISKVSGSGNKLSVQICWEYDDRFGDDVFGFSVRLDVKPNQSSTCLGFLSALGVKMTTCPSQG